MDESDKLQRDTNLRFHALCQQAREWVVETLKAKGCNCRIQDHYVVTTAYDEASGEDAQARLAIFPLIGTGTALPTAYASRSSGSAIRSSIVGRPRSGRTFRGTRF